MSYTFMKIVLPGTHCQYFVMKFAERHPSPLESFPFSFSFRRIPIAIGRRADEVWRGAGDEVYLNCIARTGCILRIINVGMMSIKKHTIKVPASTNRKCHHSGRISTLEI